MTPKFEVSNSLASSYLDNVRPHLIEPSARRAVRHRSTHALFLSAHGTRLKPGKLTDRLHEYLRKAGIEKPGSVERRSAERIKVHLHRRVSNGS
jgi:site-specific recombinase XerD